MEKVFYKNNILVFHLIFFSGVLKKCDAYMPNCATCLAWDHCSKCYPNFFLSDSNKDSRYDSCVCCDFDSGCENKTVIFKEFKEDGSGTSDISSSDF